MVIFIPWDPIRIKKSPKELKSHFDIFRYKLVYTAQWVIIYCYLLLMAELRRTPVEVGSVVFPIIYRVWDTSQVVFSPDF